MKHDVTDLKLTDDSAGVRVNGKVNGKLFWLTRTLSTGSQGNRYTRGLANTPTNWHVEGNRWQEKQGIAPLTRSEKMAAKSAGMVLVDTDREAKWEKYRNS